MATTIDWPTSDAFRPAQMSVGLEVAEATFTGAYTGNKTRRSALADRLVLTLTLPPCLPAQAREREALLLALKSNGYWLRMGVPGRSVPVGTARGTLQATGAQTAATRTLTLDGALATPNLLANAGFEIDTNSDGTCDGWAAYYAGGASAPALTREAGYRSTYAQQVWHAGAVSIGYLIGVVSTAMASVTAGQVYSLGADVIVNRTQIDALLLIEWYTSGDAFLSQSSASAAAPTSWGRLTLVGATAPATAAKAYAYIVANATASLADMLLAVDNVQLERAATASAYAGLATLAAGDLLEVGTNTLIQVAYPGATATDAGAMSVPLVSPLPVALANDAAIGWSNPRGLWELDDDGVQLDYSAPSVQGGVTIRLRQVISA